MNLPLQHYLLYKYRQFISKIACKVWSQSTLLIKSRSYAQSRKGQIHPINVETTQGLHNVIWCILVVWMSGYCWKIEDLIRGQVNSKWWSFIAFFTTLVFINTVLAIVYFSADEAEISPRKDTWAEKWEWWNTGLFHHWPQCFRKPAVLGSLTLYRLWKTRGKRRKFW